MKGACRMHKSLHGFGGSIGPWNRNWTNAGGDSGPRPSRVIWAGAGNGGRSGDWVVPDHDHRRHGRVDSASQTTCGGGDAGTAAGAGRRPLAETDPGLLAALEALIEPTTRGDPESPLRGPQDIRRLADELTREDHPWVRSRWPSCCGKRDTACKPTARHGKGPRTPTATPSSSTSTRASSGS